jgi:hypothetical protein
LIELKKLTQKSDEMESDIDEMLWEENHTMDENEQIQWQDAYQIVLEKEEADYQNELEVIEQNLTGAMEKNNEPNEMTSNKIEVIKLKKQNKQLEYEALHIAYERCVEEYVQSCIEMVIHEIYGEKTFDAVMGGQMMMMDNHPNEDIGIYETKQQMKRLHLKRLEERRRLGPKYVYYALET